MRRLTGFVLLGIVAVLTSITWTEDSAACGRRRYQRGCIVYYAPCLPANAWAGPSIAQIPPLEIPGPVTPRFFVSPTGRVQSFFRTTDRNTHEENQRRATARTVAAASLDDDDFNGTDRAAAKTSISDARVERFEDLGSLLDSLPDDADMQADPGITKAEDSQRVARENRNVIVTTYLYAASKEKDNDFHLILGDADAAQTRRLMNAEISGLPDGAFRAKLQIPRNQFKSFFGPNGLSGRSYDVYYPDMMRVRIQGSLFFDIDHAPGRVGTGIFKPKTSWEIHPITSIEFLQP